MTFDYTIELSTTDAGLGFDISVTDWIDHVIYDEQFRLDLDETVKRMFAQIAPDLAQQLVNAIAEDEPLTEFTAPYDRIVTKFTDPYPTGGSR